MTNFGRRERISRRIAGALVVAGFLVFCLAWWNRSLNPAIAGDVFFGFAHEHGWVPYRDFYYAAPPGMYLLGSALRALFGPRLIALWTFGLLLRAASVFVLYRWLSRHFHFATAAIATATAAIASCGDVSDSPYFYHHVALAFGTFGAYALAQRRRPLAWAAAAGVLLAINSLIKQTSGVLVTFAVVGWALFSLWRIEGRRQALRVLGAVAAGFAVPWVLTVAWLHRVGVLGLFLDVVFGSGTKAKGTLAATLLRPILLSPAMVDLRDALALALAALAAAALLRFGAVRARVAAAAPYAGIGLLALAPLALVSGLLGPDSRMLGLAGCYVALFGNLAILARALLRKPSLRDAQIGLLAALGFSATYSLAISWPAFEVMLFPGLALPIALALHRSTSGAARPVVRAAAVALCIALTVATSLHKAMHPGGFAAWEEPPIAETDTTPAVPEFAGFVLNRGTADFYDITTELIRKSSREGDRIFTYPIFPEFYALADRLPVVFAISHLLDVCPDAIAAADAARLLASPPEVIVAMKVGERFYGNSEILFRGGHPSGQREIQRALAALRPRYRVVGEVRAPGSGMPIEVLALTR